MAHFAPLAGQPAKVTKARMMTRLFLLLIFLCGIAAAPARAEPLSRVVTDYTTAEIFADRDGFVAGEATRFAVRLTVRDKWHVFWVNPGDAGLALQLDWRLPDGFTTGAIDYPAPHYIPVGPLASYAHEGAPVFLISVTAANGAGAGEMVDVTINASWQACEEICVPETARFEFSLPQLPASEIVSDLHQDLFASARAEMPTPHQGTAFFKRRGDALQLVLPEWPRADAPENAFFFVEQEGLTLPAGAQSAALSDGALVVTMEPGWTDLPSAGEVRGVLRVNADEPIAIVAERVPDEPFARPSQRGLMAILALAFIGGVILNAMPCVFPILFVKAASLVGNSGRDQAGMRREAAAYGAGVLATFLLIGAVLILLRAGGAQIGWGFHLQSPFVVGLSSYVLFAVGLNLAGVFSVGETISGTGDSLTRRDGLAGAFFTGALAVVVAAPCIGPLLTAPMGAALAMGPLASLSIFTALAAGLAAPFMIVTAAPALAQLLPKPGAWMNIFKQALSFPVFAAAAFFLWVFARQTGGVGLGGGLVGAILLAFAAWLFQLSKAERARALPLRLGAGAALLAAVIPLMLAKPMTSEGVATGSSYNGVAAEPFTNQRLADYRHAGEAVFIDFTAAWCVTCQVNKLTVLTSDEVTAAFNESGARLLVADWTLRDPEITAALESYGAAGVPLYVYYGADGEAQILPQTLSKRIVIETLTNR